MNDLPPLEPLDEYNTKLLENVHPTDWKNPTPAEKYNLVVIGAGTAGLVTASVAAGLGAKVALVERHFMGGDCLNVGCVPSKAIIRCARTVMEIAGAGEFGVRVRGDVEVDFPAIMERLRKLRSDISPVDSAARFRDMGIDVFLGSATFVSDGIVEVKGARLNYAKAVICTGARAAAPDITGLDAVDYLTNETVFNLTELPEKLLVIGGGAIGCEMAQSFAAFGSEVTIVNTGDRILSHDDPDAADIVAAQMKADGVTILTGAGEMSFTAPDRFKVETPDGVHEQSFDRVLIAVGRAPNVQGMGLENVGVNFSEKKGIEVNDQLITTNKNILAAGDVASRYKFTHAADFMARNVIRNALFFGRKKASDLIIPWCTYTTPELAHVGKSVKQAKKDGVEIETCTQQMEHTDRAILDGETAGFVRVHVAKGSDKILGATIVAPNAGDMISQLSQAMTKDIGLGGLADVISPYPTQAEAIRKLGDAYNKEKFTGSLALKVLAKIIEWRR